MSARQALATSTVLDDKYRIDRVIGAGGFGITYAAEHVALHRTVAIKEFFPTEFAMRGPDGVVQPLSEPDRDLFEYMRTGFLKEARAISRFDHPSITQVLGVFEALGTVYIVMRYEDGPSLKIWLQGLGRRPTEAEIDGIAAPLLEALQYIHALGYLHRDLAPDNILLRADLSPVLIDFGAARPIVTAASARITGIVKQGFSPPEQYSTDARSQGPWTDIYALAGTLYQCVTGNPPAEATQRMLGDDMPAATDAARGQYRASLLLAIDRGLVVQPRERPQTIAAWREMFDLPGRGGHGPARDERQGGPADGAPPAATLDGGAAASGGIAPPDRDHSRAQGAPASSPVPEKRRRRPALALLSVLALIGASLAAVGLALDGRLGTSRTSPPAVSPKARQPAKPLPLPRAVAAAPPVAVTPPAPPVPIVETAATSPPPTGMLIDLARGSFRDCATCPELVVIPGGQFTMGSPPDEAGHQANEAPPRAISLTRPFALGRFEATRGDWRLFSDASARSLEQDCRTLQFQPELIADYEAGRARAQWAATGRHHWDDTNYPQDDTHPVACVSYADTEAYLAWLGRRTGATYRLPSEAEWEYAARAGTATPFSFGATITPRDASYHHPSVYPGGEAASWRRGTQPVGSFAANRFGLHDMHGNVWEWVADCTGALLSDLDPAGLPHTTTDCATAVMRGGAFWTSPHWTRSAFRYAYGKALRGAAAGFRVARTLEPGEVRALEPLLARAQAALGAAASP